MATPAHSWPLTPLGEVLTERKETPSVSDLVSGAIRIISKIGFSDGKIQIRPDTKTRTGMILVRPGDLVVSGINAAKGAVAIYGEEDGEPVAATIHYGAYVPKKDRVNVRFLWWLLRSEVFRDILDTNLPGGIKTELKAKRLLPIKVPLPALDEQRRIVSRIEELAAKVEEAQRLRRETIEEAGKIMNSEIAAIFESGKQHGWYDGVLGDYVIDDCYGTSEKTNDDSSGTPILRMGNIQNGRLDLRALKYLRIREKEREKLILKRGDILVNRTNSAELVGKCAVFDAGEEYGFASYIIRLRLDTTRAIPRLVAAYINSPKGRAYMFSERKQMTGQANVNSKKLKALPIALPSLAEQERVLEQIDTLQLRVAALNQHQCETAAELDALIPSILSRAFRGQL